MVLAQAGNIKVVMVVKLEDLDGSCRVRDDFVLSPLRFLMLLNMLHRPLCGRTTMSLVIGNLQRRPRQVGAAALRIFITGGAIRATSLDIQGENPWSNLHWLYLVMTDFATSLLKA
jgi:hypothetical protein